MYKNSFVPSTVSAWNNLSEETRNVDSIYKFKSRLNRPSSLSRYFHYGKRKLNVIHTQLRHGCSKLNYDLFRVNLAQSPKCTCGNHSENAEHFFIYCPLYRDIRLDMSYIFNRHASTFNVGLILYGDNSLSNEVNEILFKAVHSYILKSKRFE